MKSWPFDPEFKQLVLKSTLNRQRPSDQPLTNSQAKAIELQLPAQRSPMEVGFAQPEEPSESEKPEKSTYLYTQHGR
ncbi:MAG: hypothetical protein DWH78_11810 [Planctomycetota bacterium]|nr:MAG: hypothetical protein DWH78_11810 [Planctomycetota bacterium]